MGQKVSANGIRLGIKGNEHRRNSVWYSDKDFKIKLQADMKAREYLENKVSEAGISSIRIERPSQNARIIIKAARPGLIIGRKGDDLEKLKKQVSIIMKVPVHIDIEEIKRPESDARNVARSVAKQLESRVMFRRAMKRAISSAQRAGVEGIKIQASGRLGGAEIARTEGYHEGRVPLQTFRADIDYGFAEALTTYGIIGVKVWIYKGESSSSKSNDESEDKKHRNSKKVA